MKPRKGLIFCLSPRPINKGAVVYPSKGVVMSETIFSFFFTKEIKDTKGKLLELTLQKIPASITSTHIR